MLLTCTKCGKTLDSNCFDKNKSKKSGYNSWCKQCKKELYEKTRQKKESIPEGYKKCGKCKQIKPVSEFNKSSAYGYQSYCKQCKKDKYNSTKNYEPQQIGTKLCSSCGKEKYINEFSINRKSIDGRSSRCKECISKYDASRIFSVQQEGTKYCPRCKQTLPIIEFCIARGNPDGRFYCCKSCAEEYQKEIVDKVCIYCGKQFKGKREIDYACPECKLHTVPENKLIQVLNKYNIDFISEYSLKNKYWYDFYLPDYNILIDVSPTETHCAYTKNQIFTPKLPEYHYDRLQVAKLHNLKYINIWAWDNTERIVEAIVNNTLQIKQGNIQKHWGKEKTSEHLFDNNFNEQEMISEGWLPIYDDGQTLIY